MAPMMNWTDEARWLSKISGLATAETARLLYVSSNPYGLGLFSRLCEEACGILD